MVFMFNIVVFLNILSKIFVYDINNEVVMVLMTIWLLIVLAVTFLFQYTKTIIIIEQKPVFDAIKESIGLSIENWYMTIKLVVITLIF